MSSGLAAKSSYLRLMTDDEGIFRGVHPDQPINGPDAPHERLVAEYLDYVAQVLLGPPGRMISTSKVWFRKRHPDHPAVFNANVCIAPPRKIWFGDLDLTEDEPRLAVLARALDTKVYVLNERDGRFGGRDENPLLERAVLVVAPDGEVEHGPQIRRAEDGRLRPAT